MSGRSSATGHLGWLLFALVLQVLSFVGHAVLFRAVSIDADGDSSRIGFRASTEITLAGHAATRLFASAGAGGIALTAWALKRSGMEARDVAARMTTFMVLLYSVYMGALLFGGLGLYTGIIPGGGSFAMTIVPAIFGGAVIALVAAAQLVQPGERRLRRWLAPVGDGVRDARRLLRRGNAGLRRRADVVGVRHRLPVGVLQGVRRLPGRRRARARLLHRHARQHAPAPRRRRRRRRRHDRRVRRLRRGPAPARSSPCSPTASSPSGCRSPRAPWPSPRCAARSRAGRPRTRARSLRRRAPPARARRRSTTARSATSTVEPMEGFGGFFNDPDFQRRMQEMAEQMQASQSLAWADNAIKLAVDMTVAAINRVNIQGTTEQQAQQIRSVMATVFPEAVTLGARSAPRSAVARSADSRAATARCSGG